MTGAPLVTAMDLACARGQVPLLSGVSFSVEPGEALILRGPNGIGKTTLLRCLAGLQPLLSGNLTCPEDDLAYAGHADGVKAMLTVAENLRFWAEIFGGGEIETALDQMNLSGLRDRFAQNLSAGQRRRLGLARLLLAGRRIWLLDEPTVSLDQQTVGLFETLLARHLSGGGAAIIATHIEISVKCRVLDLAPFKVQPMVLDETSEAFL